MAEPDYPAEALETETASAPIIIPAGTVRSTDKAVRAEDKWNDAILIWGRQGWLTVARLCRWARANGMTIDCPKEGTDQ